MCGRYSAGGSPSDFDSRFDVPASRLASVLGRFNVAPRQEIGLIERAADGTTATGTARWGLLPRWAKTSRDRLQPINARDDKLASSKLWAPLLASASHRVLIPADGWYEWLHAESKGERPAPFLHRIDDGAWFAFAGLVNTTRVDDLAEPITTAAIITTTANGPASRIHDRMPAVLAGPDAEAAWLSPNVELADALTLLGPIEDGRVTVTAASQLVNKVANEGPQLHNPNSA